MHSMCTYAHCTCIKQYAYIKHYTCIIHYTIHALHILCTCITLNACITSFMHMHYSTVYMYMSAHALHTLPAHALQYLFTVDMHMHCTLHNVYNVHALFAICKCITIFFFVSGGGSPFYPEIFTVLHNDPAGCSASGSLW